MLEEEPCSYKCWEISLPEIFKKCLSKVSFLDLNHIIIYTKVLLCYELLCKQAKQIRRKCVGGNEEQELGVSSLS
jgi:hypothetical protein